MSSFDADRAPEMEEPDTYRPCSECDGDGIHGPAPEDGCERCQGSGCEPIAALSDKPATTGKEGQADG